MKIYLGCDHAGFNMRNEILNYLNSLGYETVECLFHEYDKEDDYTDSAEDVVNKVSNEEGAMGVLCCGTGIGMSIAANRNRKIRAAVCTTEFEAEMTRKHNDANILCLGERVIDIEQGKKLAKIFFETEFSGEEKHIRRIERLS